MPEKDLSPEELKPLLQERNDALDFLSVAEVILKEDRDDKLQYIFSNEDVVKLKNATDILKKQLLGEYDQFDVRTKPPVPLDKMKEVRTSFEEVLSTLPYRARDYFRTKMFHKQDDREERLEKSFEAYAKPHKKPEVKKHPIPTEAPKAIPKVTPEESKPSTFEKEWPTVKDTPGIKRLPSNRNNEAWLKLIPAISEIASLPLEAGKKIGSALTDKILDLLDNESPLEVFMEDVYDLLPWYYHGKNLDVAITRRQEALSTADVSDKNRLEKELVKLEERRNNISKMNSSLKFLHENWIPEPMENKSNLIKNIGNYFLTLGDRQITLTTTELSASIKFTSDTGACRKYLELTTEKDIEAAFDVTTLLELERQSADIASLIKPGTRGPSAEEEKPMVTAIVEWLNSKNAQGTEQDIEKLASEYLSSKAPDYATEDVERVARKVYAEWKASQPVPSEVGQEGKANVGVANTQGTGVYVEPSRGDTGVQNEAPTATVRKEASAGELCSQCDQGAHERCTGGECACGVCKEMKAKKGMKKEADADLKNLKRCKKCAKPEMSYRPLTDGLCEDCTKTQKEGSLLIIAVIVKREDGWHVMSEKGKHLGGPYKSRSAAKKRLQQVEMFKHMKKGEQEESLMSFNVGESALLNTRVGDLDEGTEVTVTSCSEDEVSFTAGDILGITKLANLDKIVILKEAASPKEKYPWDNDGLDYKFNLDDRVKVGSTEYDGMDLKGKEGTIRDKVIVAANGNAEKYYTVELDGCGTATLPEEVLSKAAKTQPHAWREAALNHSELSKEAVIKPNFDAAQEFLNSYDHPPTVVTTADIEAWFSDPKNNYQYSRKDMKEIVKYLQSAKVEVRVPVEKKVPDVLPEEAAEGVAKEAKQYKTEKVEADGTHTTITKDTPADLGPSFETEDPATPGQKIKWTASSLTSEATCMKCAGVGSLPCECMDDALWLSKSCAKCGDEGSMPCPSCKK